MSSATYDEIVAFATAFQPFAPELQEADLFPTFAALREELPIAWSEQAGGFWIITRFEDIRFVLQNPEIFSSRAVLFPFTPPSQPSIPLNLDGADHTRYRRLLAPLFSPARAVGMEDEIRSAARRQIAQIVEQGSCDFIEQFARPVPSRTFLASFAIPDDRLADMSRMAEAAFTFPGDEEGMRRGAEARRAVDDYFREVVEERRRHGATGDDVVSSLIRAEIDGQALRDDELVNILNLMTSASLDTTASAIVNIVAWLAEHPHRRDELVREPDLWPAAVEEFLRYDQMTLNGRIVARDIEVRGVEMRAGDRVMMLSAASGRDAAAYVDPDVVRFDRPVNRHLAFGAGPHRCLGSHLARTTLRIELEEWHRAFPRYRVTPGTTVRRRLTVLRAVTKLHLTIDAD